MKLNLSQFKKVKEDEKSAVLKHQKGHEISIAKKSLSPKLRDQLASLPIHYDVGGMVNNVSADEDQKRQMPPSAQPTIIINNGQPAPQAAPDYMSNGTFDVNKFVTSSPTAPLDSKIQALQQMDQNEMRDQQAKEAAEKSKMEQEQKAATQAALYNQLAQKRGMAPMAVPAGMAPAAVPSMVPAIQQAAEMPAVQQPSLPSPGVNDPFGSQTMGENYIQGVNEQKMGILQQAEAEAQQGNNQANLLAQGIQNQQQQVQDFKTNYDKLELERKHFVDDIQNQHVDPSHYLNSMGTGQKVATAIGLILGGMSSGFNGGKNPALDFLNAQIDRDIAGQKTQLGKNENLLSANMKQFGNMKDAADMTKAMSLGILSNQLQMAAAKAQDPLAKSRALQAAGQLDQQAAPILADIAKRQTLSQGAMNGKIDPSSYIRMAVPEASQHAFFEELQKAQNAKDGLQVAQDAFNRVRKIGAVSANTPFSKSKTEFQGARNQILLNVIKSFGSNPSDTERKEIEKWLPNSTDTDSQIEEKQRNMRSFLQSKMNYPMLDSIGLKNFSVTSIPESPPKLK